jgi:hypothetical protein
MSIVIKSERKCAEHMSLYMAIVQCQRVETKSVSNVFTINEFDVNNTKDTLIFRWDNKWTHIENESFVGNSHPCRFLSCSCIVRVTMWHMRSSTKIKRKCLKRISKRKKERKKERSERRWCESAWKKNVITSNNDGKAYFEPTEK